MEMSFRAAGHHVAVHLAAVAVILLCACAGSVAAGARKAPAPPPAPPKEICSRTFVLTEVFNPRTLITPTGIQFSLTDLSPIIGYTIAYTDDDLFLGKGVTNSSVLVGKVTSVCYILNPIDSYCTSTVTFGSFGDLTSFGPFGDSTGNTFQNAIPGGTGIFSGAQGSMKVEVLSGGQLWAYTITLTKAPKCT
ncbi:hypothetical protein Vafri_21012 [Volvox africanus]|uniref:Dirigent protein n=1 Tax=Volvox africanus TaxID=51714 RepID=A0A8J4FDP4_9CHLO|nr:hypothetical protein Vafri_21012 [Volvox africanus]